MTSDHRLLIIIFTAIVHFRKQIRYSLSVEGHRGVHSTSLSLCFSSCLTLMQRCVNSSKTDMIPYYYCHAYLAPSLSGSWAVRVCIPSLPVIRYALVRGVLDWAYAYTRTVDIRNSHLCVVCSGCNDICSPTVQVQKHRIFNEPMQSGVTHRCDVCCENLMDASDHLQHLRH